MKVIYVKDFNHKIKKSEASGNQHRVQISNAYFY